MLERLLSGIDTITRNKNESHAAKWLDRTSFLFLLLMLLAAPYSIAATQTAWLLGMAAWVIRLCIKPRPGFKFYALDAVLLGFFGWTIISSIFSYAPDISLDKLRGASLFLIFYFVRGNIRTPNAAKIAALTLIFSCTLIALWTPLEHLIGRGVEVHGLAAHGPLAKAGLPDSAPILKVNGRKVSSPEELLALVEQNMTAEILYYHPFVDQKVTIRRDDLLTGKSAAERLGFESWNRNRNWRAKGFFGHFTTFSEVLQLIASLTLGILISAIKGFPIFGGEKITEAGDKNPLAIKFPLLAQAASAAAIFGILATALILTGTRASQVGLFLSAGVMAFASRRKRIAAAFLLLSIPAVIGGVLVLKQTRDSGESNDYRKMMWRDGVRLTTDSPRNLFLGVGMDSIKRFWREWDMFDGGRLPISHFHSTPIQLMTERGVPALLLWLTLLAMLARKFIRSDKGVGRHDILLKGATLGALGGLAGFFISGLVHYNLGDGEVAMVFYLVTGLGLRACELAKPLPEEPSQAIL